jgi:hypothetical protein
MYTLIYFSRCTIYEVLFIENLSLGPFFCVIICLHDDDFKSKYVVENCAANRLMVLDCLT